MGNKTNEQKLSQLEQEFEELKAVLPEHCSGAKGYVGIHQASLMLWQKTEKFRRSNQKAEGRDGLVRDRIAGSQGNEFFKPIQKPKIRRPHVLQQ